MRTSRTGLFLGLLIYFLIRRTSRQSVLREADDFVVWEWAKKHGFTIVSKDTDFHQRAIVFGHPPKVIWLRVGNNETSLITNLLRSRCQVIRQFIESETESLLVLERPQT